MYIYLPYWLFVCCLLAVAQIAHELLYSDTMVDLLSTIDDLLSGVQDSMTISSICNTLLTTTHLSKNKTCVFGVCCGNSGRLICSQHLHYLFHTQTHRFRDAAFYSIYISYIYTHGRMDLNSVTTGRQKATSAGSVTNLQQQRARFLLLL